MKKIILSLIAASLLFSCNNYEKSKEGLEIKTAPYSTTLGNRYRIYDNHKKPGYGIMVMKDGEIEHVAGYGMANIEEKKPIIPQTKFQSWILYDQAVIISLLKLWEDGKVDLDAPITNYITSLPEDYSQVKVDYIIGRTSGFTGINQNKLKGVKTTKDMLEIAASNPKFKHEAGTYGAFEGGLIERACKEAIIESVTGIDIVTYINEEVFKPLKLENSQVYSEPVLDKSGLAYYKRRSKKLIPITYTGWTAIGADTTITNMEDLAIFFKAIDYKEFVSDKVYNKLTGISKLSDGSDAKDLEDKFSDYHDPYFTPLGYLSIPKEKGVKSVMFGDFDQATKIYPDDGYRIFVVNNIPGGKSFEAINNKIERVVFPELN